jgi:hypothetical protein
MLSDLDATLEALLRGNLPDSLLQNLRISFAAPDDHFPPASVQLPALNLFLFLIQENRELRNREPSFERRDDGSVSKQPASVRVDYHYLVTAFAEGHAP